MYTSGGEEEEEPEWVKNEKEQFSSYRDKNGDGFLDSEEVSTFLLYFPDSRIKSSSFRIIKT